VACVSNDWSENYERFVNLTNRDQLNVVFHDCVLSVAKSMCGKVGQIPRRVNYLRIR
jgi:hypothetical protein